MMNATQFWKKQFKTPKERKSIKARKENTMKMKLTIEKKNLVNAVNIVTKAVPSRTTMPILQCILINALDGKIKFSGNDLELGIDTAVEGTVEEKGMVCLDAKVFGDIVRKLPDGDVTISVDDKFTANIKCGRAKFKIVGKDGKDFTQVPLIVEETNSVEISEFSLKEIIQKTSFAASPDSPQKIMQGICLKLSENNLQFIALDGHRIAKRNMKLAKNYDNLEVVVPAKVLNEISKIIPGDADSMVKISFDNYHIVFKFDQTVVVSRLLEGKYFPVDKMLSKDYAVSMTINKRELLDSLDRSTLMVREGDRKPIIMDIKGESFNIKMTSFVGVFDESIEMKHEGEDLMIGFNPKFLIDALRAIDEEEVSLYMINPKAPCSIRDKNDQYTYLILPVNFNPGDVA